MAQLGTPPRELPEIKAVEDSLILPHFTADDAWSLGNDLRTRLLNFPQPVVVNISLANSNQVLFHTCTRSGTAPENDRWVSRKRATVLTWGFSTWYMHNKCKGDETHFRERYQLGDTAGNYAIHGGGFPLRVKGVEGIVAVVVVSGLAQHEDHQLAVEVLQEWIKNNS
ncbi:hypothetical protein LTS18_006773 [Coniosporium uncinatum]|uniref:Uncharacterized protein n=1 Tax=Coniosporium uncinatum TaxID=93489 RepID=A0ACC3DQ47_9PEZI|nr:hypothetical protein LTS18_006773 [Coniosporium uncinatum]